MPANLSMCFVPSPSTRHSSFPCGSGRQVVRFWAESRVNGRALNAAPPRRRARKAADSPGRHRAARSKAQGKETTDQLGHLRERMAKLEGLLEGDCATRSPESAAHSGAPRRGA